MPSKKEAEENSTPRQRLATNPHDREQQMIALADAAAEKQIREGTASSQLLTHYLKLGSSREAVEQEKIRKENLRLEAQIAQINQQVSTEELMSKVLSHITVYMGVDEDDDL